MVTILFLLLGIAIGSFGTLVGAGGGFLLVPILVILYPDQSPENITSISLAIVFFNALSGTVAYGRMHKIHYGAGITFSLAAIPGSILGALTTHLVPQRLFDIILAAAMLAGAVYLVTRPHTGGGEEETDKGQKHAEKQEDREDTPPSFPYNRKAGILLSLAVGYISSLLGIGGGIIHVPVLVDILRFPVHIATATSHFILAIMALSGTIVHIVSGNFSTNLHLLLPLAAGVAIGAQLGASLSGHLKGVWILRSLAIAMGFVALRLLLIAIR